MAPVRTPTWLSRWFWKLLKLWAFCAVVYIACMGGIMLIVPKGQIKLTPFEQALAFLAAGAVVLILISGMGFLVLSAQRFFYRLIPPSRKKDVFWIKWLEDREIRRYNQDDRLTD